MADESTNPDKDEEYYGSFMTALFGLLDDAELSGYSAEGREHLRRARDTFMREFLARHPSGWTRSGQRERG